VTDLSFEAKAQVGSKTYRIDILIKRDGEPWIVVECKRSDHAAHDKAMEQAISYADAQRIQAEFAIYTNGDVWHVRRHAADGWVPVLDLPAMSEAATNHQLVDHLRVLQSMMPMLHMLDQEIKGRDAARFLGAMKRYFDGAYSWCYGQDRRLLHAVDNLLRVIADPSLHIDFRFGKLKEAVSCLDRFAGDRGLHLELQLSTSQATLDSELRFISAQWQSLIVSSDDLGARDTPLVSLIAALLDYGQSLPSTARKYHSITPAIHSKLRVYLATTLVTHFGLNLPDIGDEIPTSDLRAYCEDAWKGFDNDI